MLFGLIPAGVVFGVYLESAATIEGNVASQFNNLAVSSGDIIDRNLFERYGDVQAFTLNGEAHNPANYKKPGASNPLVRVMNGYTTNYGLYKLMVLTDTAGNVLAVNSTDAKGETISTNAIYGRNFSDAAWFKNAIGGKFLDGRNGLTGTAITEPYREPVVAEVLGATQDYVIAFSAPLKDNDGKTVGVWVNFAGFDLVEQIVSDLYGSFADQGLSSTEITVLDRQGTVLVDYDPKGQRWKTYPRNFEVIGKLNLVKNGVAAATEAVVGKKSGVTTSLHARKKIMQVSGYAHTDGAYDYPGLGWSVLVRAPVDEVFATLHSIVRLMIITIGAAALVILAGGFYFGNSIAKPLQNLTSCMLRLAEGNLSTELPTGGRADEIGGMTSALHTFKINALHARQAEQTAQEEKSRMETVRRAGILALADNFERTVGELVKGVAAASTELQATAENMSTTSGRVSQQASVVSAAAEQTKQNVSTVSSATEELSASFSEINKRVSDSAGIISEAVSQTEDTARRVEELDAAAQKNRPRHNPYQRHRGTNKPARPKRHNRGRPRGRKRQRFRRRCI